MGNAAVDDLAAPLPAAGGDGAVAHWRAMLSSVAEFAGHRLFAALGITLLSSVLEGVGLLMLLPIADVVFSGGGAASACIVGVMSAAGADTPLQQLSLLSAVFLCLMAVRAWVLLSRDVLLAQLSQGYADHVRTRTFSALASAEWPLLKRLQRAHLLDDMTINVARIAAAIRFVSQGVVTALLLVVYVVSAFVVNPWLGLVLLGLCALTLAAASVWMRRIGHLGSSLTHSSRQVMSQSTRFLEGLKAAKACRAETEFVAQFETAIAKSRTIGTDFTAQQGRSRRVVEMAGAIAAVALLLIGYGVLHLTGAELLIMAAIVLRLIPNLVALLGGLQSAAFALPAFAATENLRQQGMVGRAACAQVSPPDAKPAPRATGPIVVDRVIVTMDNGDATATLLETDSFTIGETGLVYIGGASGSGKSTFVELLAGLYLPTSGVLRRGGVSLDHCGRPAWQDAVAYVPQEPFLFDATVRENLCWPNVNASDDDIWRVLSLVQAADFVRALPAQVDELLRDNGNRLSGGQRQRLCIARALLRPANVLILDEATSAIDPDAEGAILETLSHIATEKTVIIVSHSTTALRLACQCISIVDGHATARPCGDGD